jgi:putative hemolysin
MLSLPLIVCLIIVAWLTAAATAVRSVSRIWLRYWVERQLRGAPTAELYLERPQRLLLAAATAVATTVFVAGTLIGALTAPHPLIAARTAITYALLLLVFGQLIPRAIGRRFAAAVIPVLLPPVRAIELALTPLLHLVQRAIPSPRQPSPLSGENGTREGIEDLLREGEIEGVGAGPEIAIISGVVQFGHKTLREVMTPRAEIFALDDTVRGRERAVRIAQSRYSRIPIYHGTVDEVLGFIHAFDVLKDPDAEPPPIRPLPDLEPDAKCNATLSMLLRSRRHMGMVRDTAGHVIGLVTLEDLLEELVGDIRDEHDEPAPARAAHGTA